MVWLYIEVKHMVKLELLKNRELKYEKRLVKFDKVDCLKTTSETIEVTYYKSYDELFNATSCLSDLECKTFNELKTDDFYKVYWLSNIMNAKSKEVSKQLRNETRVRLVYKLSIVLVCSNCSRHIKLGEKIAYNKQGNVLCRECISH